MIDEVGPQVDDEGVFENEAEMVENGAQTCIWEGGYVRDLPVPAYSAEIQHERGVPVELSVPGVGVDLVGGFDGLSILWRDAVKGSFGRCVDNSEVNPAHERP